MKTYELQPTTDPNLFRVVDRNGDWTHYHHKPSDTYLRAVNFILSEGYAKPRLLHWAKNKTAEEIDKKLKEAGEKGDRVHQAIRLIFENPGKFHRSITVYDDEVKSQVSLTNEDWDCLLSFASFWSKHDPLLVDYEVSVCSLKEGYAGTLDALLILTKACGVKTCPCEKTVGKLGIWDWKTSGAIYGDHGAQVAAYGKAESIKPYLQGLRLAYSAILRLGTAHTTTGGYQLEVYDRAESQTHYEEFLHAKGIQNASYKPFDPKTEIQEIPDEIELVIRKYEKPKPRAAAPQRKAVKKVATIKGKR
ncbi:MAG: hypothetical protein FJW69_08920 [Actinobacteria bacterium]|nr:hypothetical protein [Actinomycetota bacterium]